MNFINFKKIISVSLAVYFLFAFTSCGKTKILHCDKCGKEVEVAEDSNMNEDWILFCSDCGDIDYDSLV